MISDDGYMGQLLERDALLLADILQDEGGETGDVDTEAVQQLVDEAGGFVTPLRRAYDAIHRRLRASGSSRDRLACRLLCRAHLAAARADGERVRKSTPRSWLFLDWGHDERPIWRVSIHYRRPSWDDAELPSDAPDRVASELRHTGMTRAVGVTIDPDGVGYELAFRIHADDEDQAVATAVQLAAVCLDAAGVPFSRRISGSTVDLSGLVTSALS